MELRILSVRAGTLPLRRKYAGVLQRQGRLQMVGIGWRAALLGALVMLLALPVGPASARTRKRHTRTTTSPALSIQVLSNRADLISAGDALVAIDGAGSQKPRVKLGSRDV